MAMAVTAVSASCVESQSDRRIPDFFGRCRRLDVQFWRVHGCMGLGRHGNGVSFSERVRVVEALVDREI
jgi:hypothetical protein